jgi:hypothetical protein
MTGGPANEPWGAADAPAQADKRFAPATERNRDAIARVLADILPRQGRVLEIASGSGEHVVHFARLFPHLRWQPSDPEPAALRSIAAWVAESGVANIDGPLELDAARFGETDVGPVDAVLCINMVHISPWDATLGLLRGAGQLLPAGAPLYLYGPYFREGTQTAPSNLAFDQSLRTRNPAWGIRWVHDVEAAARGEGLTLDNSVEMPANNLSLIFRRGPLPG